MPTQSPAGEQRNYVLPPAYTMVKHHCSELDTAADILPNESSAHDAAPASSNGPQKKSVTEA